ncbi:hypothetical protein ScalyP_jg2881 [Parmales sp. scaly parma]|nr:hypothetical protein ScalyP_jg2881 [Parmales sp. scaly parma]
MNVSPIQTRIFNLTSKLSTFGNQSGSNHGAVIFSSSGEPLSCGFNHKYTTSKSFKGGRSKVMHAEVHALRNFVALQCAGDIDVAITRLHKGSIYISEEGLNKHCPSPHDDAQPCPQCTQAIVKFGIEHVFFTKKNDELGYFHRSVKTPEDCCNFHAPSFDMAMMGQEDTILKVGNECERLLEALRV